jgi:hypothetical protein
MMMMMLMPFELFVKGMGRRKPQGESNLILIFSCVGFKHAGTLAAEIG